MKAITFFVCVMLIARPLHLNGYEERRRSGQPPTSDTAAKVSDLRGTSTPRWLYFNVEPSESTNSRSTSSTEKIPVEPMSFLTLLITAASSQPNEMIPPHPAKPKPLMTTAPSPTTSIPLLTSVESTTASAPAQVTSKADINDSKQTSSYVKSRHQLRKKASMTQTPASLTTSLYMDAIDKLQVPYGEVNTDGSNPRVPRDVPIPNNSPQPLTSSSNNPSAVPTGPLLWIPGETNAFDTIALPPNEIPYVTFIQNNPSISTTLPLSTGSVNPIQIAPVVQQVSNTPPPTPQSNVIEMLPNSEPLIPLMEKMEPIVNTTEPSPSRSTRYLKPLPLDQVRDEYLSYASAEAQPKNIAIAPYAENSNWNTTNNLTREVPTENARPSAPQLSAWPLNTRSDALQMHKSPTTSSFATQPNAMVMPSNSENMSFPLESYQPSIIAAKHTIPPSVSQEASRSMNPLPMGQMKDEGQFFASPETQSKNIALAPDSEPSNWPMRRHPSKKMPFLDTRPITAPNLNPWSYNPIRMVQIMDKVTTTVSPATQPNAIAVPPSYVHITTSIDNYRPNDITNEFTKPPLMSHLGPETLDHNQIFKLMFPSPVNVPPGFQSKPFMVPNNAVFVNNELQVTDRPKGLSIHLALTLELDYGIDVTTTITPPKPKNDGKCNITTAKIFCGTYCEIKNGPFHVSTTCDIQNKDLTTPIQHNLNVP